MSIIFEESSEPVVSTASKDNSGRRSAFALDAIQGQSKAVDLLKSYCREAKEKNIPLEHILLSGSSGLGKTVLAEAIAGEMDAVLREFSGSSISSDAALVKALTTINEGDVLIVKDIHKLNIVKMKYFSQPLKRFEIDLDIMDSTIHLELPHFTMIATTNQPDLLADEVRNAFDIQLELESNVVENIHLRKGNRVCFNSLPFVSLYIANVIGYYDAQGNAFFVSDRNMDADFKDDIVLIKKSSALDSVFKNVSEFTISPCLCVGRKRGV